MSIPPLPPPPPERRLGWRAALWIAGIAAVLFTCGGACIWTKGPTLGQVERRVRAGLPLGTSRTDTEAWLREQRLPFVSVKGPTEDQIGSERVSDRAGMAGQQVGSTIRATVYPAFVSVMWSGDVSVYLFFDPYGKLIGYDFVPFMYAL